MNKTQFSYACRFLEMLSSWPQLWLEGTLSLFVLEPYSVYAATSITRCGVVAVLDKLTQLCILAVSISIVRFTKVSSIPSIGAVVGSGCIKAAELPSLVFGSYDQPTVELCKRFTSATTEGEERVHRTIL